MNINMKSRQSRNKSVGTYLIENENKNKRVNGNKNIKWGKKFTEWA